MSRLFDRADDVSRRDYLRRATTATLTALAGLGAAGTAVAESESEDTSLRAGIKFRNQPVVNGGLTVESVYVAGGGFVTMHDTRLLDGVGAGSIIGVSEYLRPGGHVNVPVPLFGDPLETDETELRENQVLIAVPHFDTNDNREFDFLPSNPEPDVAYTNGPQAIGGLPNDGVNDVAWVTVS